MPSCGTWHRGNRLNSGTKKWKGLKTKQRLFATTGWHGWMMFWGPNTAELKEGSTHLLGQWPVNSEMFSWRPDPEVSWGSAEIRGWSDEYQNLSNPLPPLISPTARHRLCLSVQWMSCRIQIQYQARILKTLISLFRAEVWKRYFQGLSGESGSCNPGSNCCKHWSKGLEMNLLTWSMSSARWAGRSWSHLLEVVTLLAS